MTAQSFDIWLNAYGRAWIDGDPEAAVRLFTEDAAYFETPFDPPMIGHDAIRTYWHEGAELGQRDVRFSHDVVAVGADVAVARWHAAFVRTDDGTVVELDGVLIAEFDDAGCCRQFRESWHRQ